MYFAIKGTIEGILSSISNEESNLITLLLGVILYGCLTLEEGLLIYEFHRFLVVDGLNLCKPQPLNSTL